MHYAHRQLICTVMLLSCSGFSVFSQETASTEEKADVSSEIKAAIESYVAAFRANDVEKLIAHWTPGGVYTSRSDGEQVVGREAIGEGFKKIFAGKEIPQLAVATESIEFISPNVALERGTAIVTLNEEPIQSSYSTVYVKHGGKWLIDRVTEDEITVEYSNRQRLSGLEWLIGEWSSEVDGVTVEQECRRTKNENFISRTYRVSTEDGIQSSGLQIIGWDPIKQGICSWLFDSDGGLITGTWTTRDSKWVVQSVAALPDGGRGSFTSIFRPLEDGTYAWHKTNRVLDGRLLPSVPESIVQPK